MKALLIIDIQNDYFPGGASELVNPDLALDNTVKILKAFRESNLPSSTCSTTTSGKVTPLWCPARTG